MSNLRALFKKTREDAVTPAKAHPSDVGYDLTALEIVSSLSAHILRDRASTIYCHFYDTGIAVKPPDGYYFEVAPRSSICKTGRWLANSVGIIDPSYRGSIKLALYSNDPEPLQTPFRLCQLILRPALYPEFHEVEELDETERGSGGFGSTDNE